MNKSFRPAAWFSAAAIALTSAFVLPVSARAADHGDSPSASQDQSADLADLYLFRDPNDNSKVVLIGTFRGFITPGEANNFATFDPNVKYRFEIYNKHVNVPPATVAAYTAAQKAAFIRTIVPNRSIEVTFSKRQVVQPESPDPRPNLRGTVPQNATVKLIGFPTLLKRGLFTQDDLSTADLPIPLTTTLPTLGLVSTPQILHAVTINAGGDKVDFFAGEVDDPFFFDIPAFSRLVKSIHDTGTPDTTQLARARDTFAGYNVLAIAIRLPATLLQGTLPANGGPAPLIGATFLSQRHAVQTIGPEGARGAGAYKTVDRVANPGVNVALIPFNRKNAYNVGTIKGDAQGKFVGDIAQTITDLSLGTSADNIGTLVKLAVTYGDLLPLDLTKPNTGLNGGDNAGFGYPNGRRLKDDVIDTILTVLANGPIGDGVNASDPLPQSQFPFVQYPLQPFDNGVTDDKTRN